MTLLSEGFVGFPFPTAAPNEAPISLTGLALWLDGTRGVTQDGATTRVTAWTSRAGTATATQLTVAAMPVSSTLNGLPALAFDGVDDSLVLSGLGTAGDALSLFAVVSVSNFATIRCVLGGSTNGAMCYDISPAGLQRLIRLNQATLLASSSAVTAATPTLLSHTFDRNEGTGGSGYHYRNGTVSGSSVTITQTPFTAATDRIGSGTGPFVGTIGEIVLYRRVLSNAERQRVETYLKTKWGTP